MQPASPVEPAAAAKNPDTVDEERGAAQPADISEPAAIAKSDTADEGHNAVMSVASLEPSATVQSLAVTEEAAMPATAEPANDESIEAAPHASLQPAPAASAMATASGDAKPAIVAAQTAPEPTQTPLRAQPAASDIDDSTQLQPFPAEAQADTAPRRAGGASAALDVLRSAGMKLTGGRAPAAAAPAPKAAEARPKPAAPRVVVPTPDPARRAAAQQQTQAAPARGTAGARQNSGSTVPPWEEIPPDAPGALDDYIPASADDAYFAPPDDGYMPVFDQGPDDVRIDTRTASPASATAAPVLDTRPLPPAIPLDALGFEGDWPALAAGLPLKGISYQLAFNSELMALDGATLRLNVPVPQYADAAQVAKLKAALAERLGKPVEVVVEVGPARRTAAAFDAAERAQRQKEAEREIGTDPFVQSLIREFGASIVPGSVRPLAASAPDAAGAAGAAH
jgi:DNA polymerase-3 subunit gamma/tau